MTALDLYKFISKNDLEYHVEKRDFDHAQVFLHVPFALLNNFQKMLGYNFISDGNVIGTLCELTICFEMYEICERMDIHCFEIFDENKN